MKLEKYYIGDSCLCWSAGTTIEAELSLRILSVYRTVKNEMVERGVYDFVPSYNALAIHFDPLTCNIKTVEAFVDEVFESVKRLSADELKVAGEQRTIPVIYNGEDLALMSDMHSMSIREIVDCHRNGSYTVAMVGFKPHFPYLIGLDKRIETPRLKTPRVTVPEGSVAIGGAQTGIYPEASPGGWNIIGLTDPELLKEINPGDTITFKEVDSL